MDVSVVESHQLAWPAEMNVQTRNILKSNLEHAQKLILIPVTGGHVVSIQAQGSFSDEMGCIHSREQCV